ncbi:MAG: transposase [Acidimicrobiales bacterium]
MGLNRRKFTREFKEAAVRRLELGASVGEVARACEVNANVLHRWRRELRQFGAKAFTGPGRNGGDENRIAALERKVGQQVVEIDFLRGCLQHVEEQRRLQALTTRGSSTHTSKSK